MTEPLHVRVARALGCSNPIREEYGGWACFCPRAPHGGRFGEREQPPYRDAALPHYDESWEDTGPLIERLHIDLFMERGGDHDFWIAQPAEHRHGEEHGCGPTPLVAVCELILALRADRLGVPARG